MTEDKDLLPWILGGLSVAAIAMAVAVGLTGRTTTVRASSQTIPSVPTGQLIPTAPAAPMPAASALPSGTPSSTTAPSLVAAATQSDATAQIPPVTAPVPSGSRIWECTTNGVKTFSNSRCGSSAILREVGPINVMDASPVASNVHWYGPDTNDAPDYYYPDPDPPQSAGNSYPVVVGTPYLDRRRPEHPHHPNNHDRGHPRHN